MISRTKTLEKLDKLSVITGYKNTVDMMVKFIIPFQAASIIFSIMIFLFFDMMPFYTGIIIFIAGMGFSFLYPLVKFNASKTEINDHLHYFITYAGTISTMKISRGMLFKKISEQKAFGEIGQIFEKILYLAKPWTVGYANACRIMVKRTSSSILGDFLDRLAVIMDFGQDLETFLYDEQHAILDDYEVEYTKSLETIKMLQELFVSITISFAFLIGIALLAPLLLEIGIDTVLIFAISALFILDFALAMSIHSLIPSDRLIKVHKIKNNMQKKIFWSFIIGLFVSVISVYLMMTYTSLQLISALAFGSLPLLYCGLTANKEEDNITKRDKQFPTYVRVLGSAIEVRNGGVISALRSTQVHSFGTLNDMSVNLYRRLRLGNEKFKSWHYFAVETGSNIISNFSKIFSESIYLGGNAQKIGEIVSKNVLRLVSLRKLRQQAAGGLRGAFYGSMIGLIATIYICARISQALVEIFTVPQGNEDLVAFVETIIPQVSPVNFELVTIYIALIILVQSASSAWIMKTIEGGNPYAALVDFIIMIWIGAMLAWILPGMVDAVLPEFGEVWAE